MVFNTIIQWLGVSSKGPTRKKKNPFLELNPQRILRESDEQARKQQRIPSEASVVVRPLRRAPKFWRVFENNLRQEKHT